MVGGHPGEHRDAQGGADLQGHVGQSGGDAAVGARRVRHGERHRGHEHQPRAHADQQRHGQHVHRVRRRHRHPREQGEAESDQEESEQQGGLGAVAGDQAAGDEHREGADGQGLGQEGEAGVQRVVAEDLLHVERPDEQ